MAKKQKDQLDWQLKTLSIAVPVSLVLIISASVLVSVGSVNPNRANTASFAVLGTSTNNDSLWDKILEFFGFEKEKTKPEKLTAKELESLRSQIRQGTPSGPQSIDRRPPAPGVSQRTPAPVSTAKKPGTLAKILSPITNFLSGIFGFLGVGRGQMQPVTGPPRVIEQAPPPLPPNFPTPRPPKLSPPRGS